MTTSTIELPARNGSLAADLVHLPDSAGLVIFAHGSGSSRFSARNRAVAKVMQSFRLSTLLADLLTPEEEELDRLDSRYRFDIGRLGRRVTALVDWVRRGPDLAHLRIGLFGASTGAAAALVAAAERPYDVAAVVSRGGRPDLAGKALPAVAAPTLLLVGEADPDVLALNAWAEKRLRCPTVLEVIPRAGHLFEEPGALDDVAARAARWFQRYLVVTTTDKVAGANTRLSR